MSKANETLSKRTLDAVRDFQKRAKVSSKKLAAIIAEAGKRKTKTTMPPEKKSPTNVRLKAMRDKLGMTQTAFADKYFGLSLRGYQRYEATLNDDDLPGPVRVILTALENGGRLPR